MPKPIARSPLDRLPLHAKQELAAWLTTGGQDGRGITCVAARLRLKAEYGVTAGTAALSHFSRRMQRQPVASVSASGISVHQAPCGMHLVLTLSKPALRSLARQLDQYL